jgi:hypothetical protein
MNTENKYKPFDLEKALAGAPVVTRDGRKVTEIHLFKTRRGLNNVVYIADGEFVTIAEDGKSASGAYESERDLFMAAQKVTKWLNVFRHSKTRNDPIPGNWFYDSREEADRTAGGEFRIACVPIEIEI